MMKTGSTARGLGDPDPLALAAGELVRVAVQEPGIEPDQLQKLDDALAHRRPLGPLWYPKRPGEDCLDSVRTIERGLRVLNTIWVRLRNQPSFRRERRSTALASNWMSPLVTGSRAARRRASAALPRREVSREQPLRAAINRLGGEGLVESLTNGSAVIRAVTIDELLEILFVRRLLESEAAFLAAGQVLPTVLETLASANEPIRTGRSTEFDSFWQVDDRFHDDVAAASGRPLMTRMIQVLRRQARMCNLRRMPPPFADQGAEHAAVLAAIATDDALGAQTAMAEHLDNVRRRLVSWLSRG